MDCSHLSSFFLGTGRLEAAISVNSVVGAHFLVSRDFSFYSVCNELILALIGITAALLLNLFYDYNGSKKSIIANMRYTENQLQMIVGGLAAYLSDRDAVQCLG